MNGLQAFSMQKISSNVVEKCLDKGNEEWIDKFVGELCQKDFIKGMIRNQYAFFVLERAVMRS